MWEYPKSALHQAAIDAQKPERDREAAKSLAAQRKHLQQIDGELALKEIEATKIAILAKTLRLREARMVREALALSAKGYETPNKR